MPTRKVTTDRRKTPVTVRGQYFESQREAATSFNRHAVTVARHLQNGTIDNLGLGKNQPKSYVVAGVRYASMQSMARALLIPFSTLQRWEARGELVERAEKRLQTRPVAY